MEVAVGGQLALLEERGGARRDANLENVNLRMNNANAGSGRGAGGTRTTPRTYLLSFAAQLPRSARWDLRDKNVTSKKTFGVEPLDLHCARTFVLGLRGAWRQPFVVEGRLPHHRRVTGRVESRHDAADSDSEPGPIDGTPPF